MKKGSRECKLFLSAGFLVEKPSYGAGQCNNAHFLCQILQIQSETYDKS